MRNAFLGAAVVGTYYGVAAWTFGWDVGWTYPGYDGLEAQFWRRCRGARNMGLGMAGFGAVIPGVPSEYSGWDVGGWPAWLAWGAGISGVLGICVGWNDFPAPKPAEEGRTVEVDV